MSEEQKIHSFTETYVKLAIRVLELNETSPAKKARTLLTDSLPPPKDLLFNSDVAALTKELFDYGFWGINGKYESLPWDIPATRALYGLLKYEEAKEEFLGRLLKPIEDLASTEPRPDPSSIYESLKLYADCWNNDLWPYKLVVPAYNFVSDVDEIAIGGITLFKLETVHKHIQWNVSSRALEGAHAVFVRDCVWLGSGNPENWATILSDLQEAITAIRLLLENQDTLLVESIGFSEVHLTPLLRKTRLSNVYKVEQPIRIPEGMYRGVWNPSFYPALKKEDVENLHQYYFEKNDILSDLRFAVRRFNLSYSRESAEDQLIDLVIALESALLPNTRDELRYKLALRAATLIGGLNLKQSFQVIQLAYDLRSAVVHNGMPLHKCLSKMEERIKSCGVEPHNFVSGLRELTRRALIQIIRRIHESSLKEEQPKGKFIEDICISLDGEILAALELSS
jgi:hypothetical protein